MDIKIHVKKSLNHVHTKGSGSPKQGQEHIQRDYYELKIWTLYSNIAKQYETSTSEYETQHKTFYKPWWQSWP